MIKPDVSTPLVLGIDVGTGGVRAMAVSMAGAVAAEARAPLTSLRAGSAHEQDPIEWWRRLSECCREVAAQAPVGAVAVTSTSGSLVVTDPAGVPLDLAIMYDDRRPASVAPWLNARAAAAVWNASHSLTKAVWVRETKPQVWGKAGHLLHPADWLAGKLCGEFGVSDHSNTVKLGFLPESGVWCEDVARAGMPKELLPRVIQPGQVMGRVTSLAAGETGLPPGIPVVAGATDGMASLIAAGASQPGDTNTTLGTTLVWKALSKTQPRPGGGIYCHLHPSGLWAPGAASNTGPGSLEPAGNPQVDREAERWLPAAISCYVLPGQGERFPFLDASAHPFRSAERASAAEWYAAQLQSLAFVERWGYEVLAAGGVELGSRVYSAGAAAPSPIYSQLRADVLGWVVVRCRQATAAFGAAILAGTPAGYGGDVCAAIRGMTAEGAVHEPDAARHARFESLYGEFREACRRRGWQ